MEYVDLQKTEIDLELLREFPMTVIYRHSVLPFRESGGLVYVATGDPFDLESPRRAFCNQWSGIEASSGSRVGSCRDD